MPRPRTRASAGASRTHAPFGSRAGPARHHVHRVRACGTRRLPRNHRRLPGRSSASASSSPPRTRTRRCSPSESTGSGSSSTARRSNFVGPQPGISLSRSSDLHSWSAPEVVMSPARGAWWDSLRIGIGPPLLKTEHGWLLVYHGVKETVGRGDLPSRARPARPREPTRVLRRTGRMGARALRAVRAPGRRPECHLPLRPDPRRGLRASCASTTAPPTRRSASRLRRTTRRSHRVRAATAEVVKVAVLGSIAWRTPPRDYGPVGARRRADRRRTPRARGRRDALRDARLRARPPGSTASIAHGLLRASVGRRAHLGGAPRVARARAVRRVRHRPQPPRLAAARVRRLAGAPLVTTVHGFSGAAILPAYRHELGTRVHLVCRPSAGPPLRRQRLPRRRRRRAPVRSRRRRHPRVLRSHPSRQRHCGGNRDRRAGRAQARDLRPRPGPGPTSENVSNPGSTAIASPTSARSARPVGPRSSGRLGLALSSRRVRRALRPVGRRGDDVRDADDRVRTRVDARDRRPGTTGLSGSRRRRRGEPMVDSRRHPSTARSAGASRGARFSASRMVDDYLTVYRDVIAGNDSGPSRAGHPHHVS